MYLTKIKSGHGRLLQRKNKNPPNTDLKVLIVTDKAQTDRKIIHKKIIYQSIHIKNQKNLV